jgi:molybdopterin synthase catalytic subunit
MIGRPGDDSWVALDESPLPVVEATEWATTPGSGAVVTFLGVVRDHAEGRTGVTGLTYEAYEAVAEKRLTEIVAEVRRHWPAVERVALLHRTGELALSEASVAVVVSAPHRGDAFEAARFAIDTLKETVPIWKREHWAGGDDWSDAAHDARPVTSPAVPAAADR